jgi:APA family basic amino acid/polyamine antiporter
VLIGFAALIGAGIFRLTPQSITTFGGFNTVVALLMAGVSVMATALCYAEFASMVPVAGSAFTYAQAGIGLLPAWVIGLLLIFEYGVGAGAVTVNLVSGLTGQSRTLTVAVAASVVAFVLSVWLWLGALRRWSANFIVGVTWLKLLLIAIAVVGGVVFVVTGGHALPAGSSGSVPLTSGAVAAAVSVVYFAYAGFDVVTTTADEATYPRRDLPRAVLYALVVTMIIYLVVALLSTFLLGNRTEQVLDSLAAIFKSRGLSVLAIFLEVGAIIGEVTVVYVLMYGLSRILNAMFRELRRIAGRDRYRGSRGRGLPTMGAIVVVFGTIWLSALFPRIVLTELVNTAMAVAFSIIVIGTVALRRSRPDLLRTFQVPLLPFIAAVALLSNIIVAYNASWISWGIIAVFVGFLLIGYQIYAWLRAWRRTSRGKDTTSSHKLTTNNPRQPST